MPAAVRAALPVGYAARLLGNALWRSPFVFLPAIAKGLGVSRAAVATALSAREAIGLSAPVIGSVVDQGHERAAMRAGIALAAVGATTVALTDSLAGFTAGMLLVGFAKYLWDNGQNSWIGHEVAFQQRGRVLGLLETSWAGAYLFVVPVMGLLIGLGGYRLPFGVLAGVAVVLTVLVLLSVHVPARRVSGAGSPRRLPRGGIPLYVTFFFLAFGQQLLFTAAGAWLNDVYGLSAEGLGVAAVVIGAAELLGSGATIVLADRLGKRRAALGGTVALLVPAVALGHLGRSVAVAVLVLAAFAGCFEFAWVAAIPLMTEIDPQARATGIGIVVACITVSRSIAIAVGIRLYDDHGIGLTSSAAAVTLLVAIAALAGFVHEPS